MDEFGFLYPLRISKEISAQEKLLYIEFVSRLDAEGLCKTSNQLLAEFFDVDLRTIQRWKRNLEDKGFIRVWFDKSSNTTAIEPTLSRKLKQGMISDNGIRKFAEAFPNRKLDVSDLPPGIDIDLLIDKMQSCEFFRTRAKNWGLAACLKNYYQIIGGYYDKKEIER